MGSFKSEIFIVYQATSKIVIKKLSSSIRQPQVQNNSIIYIFISTQLLALADAAEDNRYQQAKAAAALSCGTRLLNLLIKLWKDMNANEFKALESALTPCVTDNGEQVINFLTIETFWWKI